MFITRAAVAAVLACGAFGATASPAVASLGSATTMSGTCQDGLHLNAGLSGAGCKVIRRSMARVTPTSNTPSTDRGPTRKTPGRPSSADAALPVPRRTAGHRTRCRTSSHEQDRALRVLAEVEGVSKQEAAIRAIVERSTRLTRRRAVRQYAAEAISDYEDLLARLADS